MTEYYMDISDADNELTRLKHIWEGTLPELDKYAAEVMILAEGATHIRTFSLIPSMKLTTETEPGTWEMDISWGGPAPGRPNNPVRYAQAERARGSSHDFVAETEKEIS